LPSASEKCGNNVFGLGSLGKQKLWRARVGEILTFTSKVVLEVGSGLPDLP